MIRKKLQAKFCLEEKDIQQSSVFLLQTLWKQAYQIENWKMLPYFYLRELTVIILINNLYAYTKKQGWFLWKWFYGLVISNAVWHLTTNQNVCVFLLRMTTVASTLKRWGTSYSLGDSSEVSNHDFESAPVHMAWLTCANLWKHH